MRRMNKESLLHTFIIKDYWKLTESELRSLVAHLRDDAIIKIVPARGGHSAPVYAPKSWEGDRVLLMRIPNNEKKEGA